MKSRMMLAFASVVVLLAVFARSQTKSAPTVTTFHNCSWVGESGNSPHLFDMSKIYKCDEGTVEIAGRIRKVIENGYLYETEMGEPSESNPPRRATPSDYREYKWCSSPGPTDPNQKEMCGDTPRRCWDGKMATWDANWQGYSCATPDHK